MINFENIKTKICLFLFLFINFIYSIKYLNRITPHYLIVSIVIVFLYSLLWSYRVQSINLLNKIKYFNVGILLVFILISSLLFIKVPCENLNVDRWSVITTFWDNYFNGDYVYFAKSNMGNPPGPMPFYFILALPFYLLGELGYFSILGVVVFLLLLRYTSKPREIQHFYILLILSSLFYLWEVVCRSNIFLNGSLVLFSIIYLLKSLENKQTKYIIWNGIFIGLLLSTRNVFIIPYIITFLFIIKDQSISLKNTIAIGVIAFISFILTFIPFVLNHFNDFKTMNPFIIQSSFLMPIEYSLICIVLSFVTIFFIKKRRDIYLYSGLILFLTIVFHFVYQIKTHHFEDAFFNSKADISYFILCIPFLLYYMIENEKINQ